MKVTKNSQGYFQSKKIDGKQCWVPITQEEYNKVMRVKELKRNALTYTGNGVALSAGVAVGEALMGAGAVAATGATAVAEAAVITPIVVTTTVVVGGLVGTVCLIKWLSKR